MTRRLIFTWSPQDTVCNWQCLDANGNREGAPQHDATLEELHEAASGRELVWLAPGADCLSISASLPAKSRDKIVRALPYALEEQFAEEPDKLFFALPAETSGSPIQAISTDREWLSTALDRLADEQLSPQRVLPDYLALPWESETWTALADAGTLYVRTGFAGGFTLETDTGWPLLEHRYTRLQEDERPQSIRYLRGREPWGTSPAVELPTTEEEPIKDGLYGVLPEGFAPTLPVNLLQGIFKRKSEWRKAAKPWQPAAYALAAVVLLAIIGFSASWIHNAQLEKQLDKQVQERFSQLMPNQPWYGNSTARRMIRTRLSRAGQSGGSMDLLSLLSALSSAAPNKLRIESLSYQGNTLQIRLHVPDVSSLESMRSTISSQSRLPVTIRSANQTDSGVDGALSIGLGARS